MNLKDFFYADKHAAGTIMAIPLPSGADSGETLRVIGPACDAGMKAAREYARAFSIMKGELATLEVKCAAKNDWTEYNAEMNWLADELNDALAAEIVIGWSLEDEFSKEAVAELMKQYRGLSTYVAQHFRESRKSLLEK